MGQDLLQHCCRPRFSGFRYVCSSELSVSIETEYNKQFEIHRYLIVKCLTVVFRRYATKIKPLNRGAKLVKIAAKHNGVF